jgi:hypothetical protein
MRPMPKTTFCDSLLNIHDMNHVDNQMDRTDKKDTTPFGIHIAKNTGEP